MPVVAAIIIGLAIFWIGWPIQFVADELYLSLGQTFLIFLAASVGIFLVSTAITYALTPSVSSHYTPGQSSRSISPDGLITGHTVSGRKVAAYETHWVGRYEFTFAFVPWPIEKHRIYILKSPSYRGRSTGAHETHRFHDSTLNRHFICIKRSVYPDTLTEAREFALMWAQATAQYIDTGENFG